MPVQFICRRTVVAFVVGSMIGCAVGYFVGWEFGDSDGYRRIFLAQREEIMHFIAGRPEFANVLIEEQSKGGASLTGQVPTTESRELLLSEMKKLFGEDRGQRLTSNVGIAAK